MRFMSVEIIIFHIMFYIANFVMSKPWVVNLFEQTIFKVENIQRISYLVHIDNHSFMPIGQFKFCEW